MMEILVGAVLLFIFVASISRFGRVKEVTSEGISIRTMLGRRVAVQWRNVRSPIRISRLPWIPIVEIKLADTRFLSLQSKVAAWVPRDIGRDALIEAMPASVKISDWT
jgi:hypothetical protein